jgi:aquaporin related protein
MAATPKESWIHRAASNPHVKGGNISVLGSHLVAASAEFLGTFFFLWLAYGGQLMALTQAPAPTRQSGGASSETVVFISLIYGFSLLVNAWAFYRISGGLFNPAASLLPQG